MHSGSSRRVKRRKTKKRVSQKLCFCLQLTQVAEPGAVKNMETLNNSPKGPCKVRGQTEKNWQSNEKKGTVAKNVFAVLTKKRSDLWEKSSFYWDAQWVLVDVERLI